MGALQRELERSFDSLPETVLRSLLRRKLKASGRHLPAAAFEALVRHILEGGEEEFELDHLQGLDLELEFTDDDIAEVERIQGALVDDLPEIVSRLVRTQGRDLFKTLQARWPEQDVAHRRDEDGFRERLRLCWGESLDLLGMLLTCCREIAAKEHQRWRRSRKRRDDPRLFVLFRLHARACQIALEVLTLLENGFADGAMARWRTLHELAVIAALIDAGDTELAQRYIDHDAVDLKRQADDYDAAHDDPIGPKQRATIDAAYDAAMARYGKDFGTPNGWAAQHLGKAKPTFRDLQDAVGHAIMNPYYKLASFNVHAGSRSMFHRLTTFDPATGPGAGRSNAGLLQPCMNTAYSFMQITAAVLPPPKDIDRQIEIRSLIEIRDRIPPALRKAASQLRRDERAFQKREKAKSPSARPSRA